LNTDKVNFVNDLKSFVYAHSHDALKKKIGAAGGKLKFKLNDQDVDLTSQEDFFFTANDLAQRLKA